MGRPFAIGPPGLVLTLVALAVACSAPVDDSREACRSSYPALAPCRKFVAEWSRAQRREELFRALDELRLADPGDWTAAYLTGYAHYVSGSGEDAPRAIASFEEAERLAAAAGSPVGRAEALLMQGAVEEFRDGRAEAALALYLRAVEQADAAGDVELWVQCAWAVATIYPELGRYADQIEWLERALERLGEQGDPTTRRALLYELGNAHRKLGDWTSAKRWLERDLESALADGDALDEALALQLLGNVEMDRDPAASLSWFERCASRAAAADLSSIEAHCEVLIGVASVQADRVEEGRQRLEATLDRSLRLAEGDVEQTVQGISNLLYLAEALRRLDAPERALELYRRARAKSEEWRKPYFLWQASAGIAAIHLSRQRYDEAIDEARRGVEQVEAPRRSIEDEARRVYWLRQRSNVYALLASALDRREPAASIGEVFETLERVHSRTLREALGERLDSGGQSVPLQATRARLAERDVLVEYLLGEDESLLLVVTRGTARLARLPPRRKIEDLVERYRRVLERPLVSVDARLDPEGDFSRTASPGRELFEIVLGPASEELARSDRLIVVPDKQLHRLPFEALPRGGARGPAGFVAETHAVLYLPAASFLTEPRPASAGDQVVVLAAGAAEHALGLAELSEVSTEVERIRRVYGAPALRVLAGPTATYERLRQALAGPVRILHIAGHAVSDPSTGPRIVLADAGADASRGLLSIPRILALAPTPPLVVLSACETGEGELVGGEGILGLVRAFRLAGSFQTVASLWRADDSASAQLMGDFHGALGRGEPPSRALAHARRELLARGFVHPFAWAAFVLYGAD